MIVLKTDQLTKVYQIQEGEKARYSTLSERLNAFKFIRDLGKAPASKQFAALRDVSFEVREGDRLGIVGKNGAGKSTLLKLISRVTSPTSGKIGINGRVASLLEVGTGFHHELTGRENIFLNGAILGMKSAEIRRKFDAIVDFSGTETFLDVPIKRYSSGMYVRLAFAVAAFLESEVLIVDEVLAVGDAAFQKKCLGKMDEISKGGRTILFVSHNLSTIESLCNRGIYLSAGEIAYDGTAVEAINRYTAETSGVEFGFNRPIDFRSIKRPGTGAVRFQNLELRCVPKVAGADADTFRVGDDLIVTTEILGHAEAKDLNVCLILFDLFGARLVDANFAVRGEAISFLPGERKRVAFRLQNLLLKPGEYIVGIWAGIPNVDVDYILDAARFRVDQAAEQKLYSIVFPGPYQCRFDIAVDTTGDNQLVRADQNVN